MAIIATVLYPIIVAFLLVFTVGKFLAWLITTERGRMAFIAILTFVAFVAASGILG